VTSKKFWKFVLVRLLLIIPTVLILVTTVFFIMRATGDPITIAVGGKLPLDQIERMKEEAGYNRPMIIQYLEYIGQVFTGNLGTDTKGVPVADTIAHYGIATFELVSISVLFALILSIPLGRLAARFRDKWEDIVLRIFGILCYATPVFFLGMVLKLIFSVYLKILPVSGRVSIKYENLLQNGLVKPTGIYLIDAFQTGNMEVVGDVLWHYVLPMVSLGLLTTGIFLRLIRTNMISTANAEYVDFAKSRGVSDGRLYRKHAWKPALIPVITVIGMQIAIMLAGAVLTETTFEWKGLGFILNGYLKARDFVAVQGIVLMIAIIVAVANFLVDVLAALIDPRVKY